mgnify:CR=1 FL=1
MADLKSCSSSRSAKYAGDFVPTDLTPPEDRGHLQAYLTAELAANRLELDVHYMIAADVVGELRYLLLGVLAELGGLCSALEWRVHHMDDLDSAELLQIRAQIAEQVRHGVELRLDLQRLISQRASRHSTRMAASSARTPRNRISARITPRLPHVI